MIQTYTLVGMTCNNCKTFIQEQLNSFDKVENVSVDLDTEEVYITMSAFISTETLNASLPRKYVLSQKEGTNPFVPITKEKNDKKSKLIQLFPLFLSFGYISVGAVLLNSKLFNVQSFMLDFMGLFFIVFSFFKLLDLKGFRDSFKMYDPLAKRVLSYGLVYPFLELSLGVLFLMRIQIPFALILTLFVLGITTFGVSKTLLDKKTIPCACLGTTLKLPMTQATFIENSIMIVMSIFMLITTYK